jgi:hypothetical protein
LATLFAAQAAALQPASALKGQALETRQVDGDTDLRLKTSNGEAWAAVPSTAIRPGAQVEITSSTSLENFESKILKKKFDRIVFGQIADPGAPAGSGASGAPATAALNPHGTQPAQVTPTARVGRASGPDARSVSEVVAGSLQLKDKQVLVRGQVVKVNTGILGKNWLHLRDGTGSAIDGSNDLLVTSREAAAIGDIVSAKGTVRTDVKLGTGHAYAVLVEDASLRQ